MPHRFDPDHGGQGLRHQGNAARAGRLFDGFFQPRHVYARLADVERGDQQATADAVLKIVDADEPPLRVILGNVILPAARATYADRLATWTAWEAVSNAAQGESRVEAVAPL